MNGNSTKHLTEDDIYRASSQFRLWSFSPEKLAALRRTTHELAVNRVRAQHASGTNGTVGEFLTGEEELRLVQRYCEQVRATNDHFKWPTNVKATAVQYLRRFYVSNSVITYPPKEIYKTALFLACKTEATHMTLSEYARRISSKPEEILAPEYKVMQALRFTLDVRQPFRGLKGVLMELVNMVEGKPEKTMQDDLLKLKHPTVDDTTAWKPPKGIATAWEIRERVQAAYGAARNILDHNALMTDVYFLYTPGQILHAALRLADSALADYYLSTKLQMESVVRPQILATITACAEMLGGFSTTNVLTKDERAALEAKLEKCRDQSTKDMVSLHVARKTGVGEDDEEKVKRKKAEREKNEQEGHDLFGPAIDRNGSAKERG